MGRLANALDWTTKEGSGVRLSVCPEIVLLAPRIRWAQTNELEGVMADTSEIAGTSADPARAARSLVPDLALDDAPTAQFLRGLLREDRPDPCRAGDRARGSLGCLRARRVDRMPRGRRAPSSSSSSSLPRRPSGPADDPHGPPRGGERSAPAAGAPLRGSFAYAGDRSLARELGRAHRRSRPERPPLVQRLVEPPRILFGVHARDRAAHSRRSRSLDDRLAGRGRGSARARSRRSGPRSRLERHPARRLGESPCRERPPSGDFGRADTAIEGLENIEEMMVRLRDRTPAYRLVIALVSLGGVEPGAREPKRYRFG